MAKKSGRPNDEYLRLYALEGFLLRLAASASSQDFILKGGVLLAAYQLRRPTADIDFAALKMPNDVETIKSMIISVADTQLPNDHSDGLWFDTSDAHGVAIRDEDEYNGVRITLGAQLSTARMRFHVDVNVGDPIWPKPQTVQFPRLLGGHIRLLGYPIPLRGLGRAHLRPPGNRARRSPFSGPHGFWAPSTVPMHLIQSETRWDTRDGFGQRSGQNAHLPRT